MSFHSTKDMMVTSPWKISLIWRLELRLEAFWQLDLLTQMTITPWWLTKTSMRNMGKMRFSFNQNSLHKISLKFTLPKPAKSLSGELWAGCYQLLSSFLFSSWEPLATNLEFTSTIMRRQRPPSKNWDKLFPMQRKKAKCWNQSIKFQILTKRLKRKQTWTNI